MNIIGTPIAKPSQFYCPLCGKPMTDQGDQIDYRKGHEGQTFKQLSCKDNPECRIYTDTLTLDSLESGEYFNRWGYTPRYSLYTGKELGNE